MHKIAHIDFETRAVTDLKKAGARRYCEDPHFATMCLAWGFDDLPVDGAHLYPYFECPPELADHVAAGRLVGVHNASFELNAWAANRRRFPNLWPELKAEQIIDTMALARILSLPADLDGLGQALRLPFQKDKEGHKLMLKLCKPRAPRKGEPTHYPLWHETPDELERQLQYCKRDVETERGVYHVLPEMSERTRAVWLLDKKINERGVAVDIESARRLAAIAAGEKDRLNAELYAITERQVKTSNSHKAFTGWFNSIGLNVPNLQKATVEKLLEVDEFPGNKGAVAKRALQIRAENSKSSVAKLTAMDAGVCRDGRLHELLEFHGASTGRYAGRRVQPQNMLRPPETFHVEDAEKIFEIAKLPNAVELLAAEYGSASAAIAYAMRSLLRAAFGHRFVTADYSNIEGRMLAFLAGEAWKLQAFREYDAGNGHDLYIRAYAKAFSVDPATVSKDQRQIGKVQELALGYQGAHGAFLSMAKLYKMDLNAIAAAVKAGVHPALWDDAIDRYWAGAVETAEEKLAAIRIENTLAVFDGRDDDVVDEPDLHSLALSLAKGNRHGLSPEVWAAVRIIVDGWREAHPRTVNLWRRLEDAAKDAIRAPGCVTFADRIAYRMRGDILECRLPSGRVISYPNAVILRTPSRFNPEKFDEKIRYEGISSKTRRWQKQYAYGGLLAENVTQAASCDVLNDAMLRLDAAGYNIALHVHDEIVTEMPHGTGSLAELSALMATLEPWAAGLPVAVAGWEGERFRKA